MLNELDQRYQENLKTGAISRNVYNLRTRGTRILREVYETGNFVWKKYEVYVDENMEPIDNQDTDAAQKVKESKAELEKLFSKANEMWQLK